LSSFALNRALNLAADARLFFANRNEAAPQMKIPALIFKRRDK